MLMVVETVSVESFNNRVHNKEAKTTRRFFVSVSVVTPCLSTSRTASSLPDCSESESGVHQ